jgi:hypothetical protein
MCDQQLVFTNTTVYSLGRLGDSGPESEAVRSTAGVNPEGFSCPGPPVTPKTLAYKVRADDLMAMSGAEEERAQNEHIERAFQECGLFDSVSGFHDSRHPILRMVDARPSITLAELDVALAGMRVSVSVRKRQSNCSRITGNPEVISAPAGLVPGANRKLFSRRSAIHNARL